MPRPGAGEITERAWQDHSTVTFGARIYAYGRRHRLVFGTNVQGWNRVRAEIELESIMQQIERGTWVPPAKPSSVRRLAAPVVDAHQTFDAFAAAFLETKRNYGLDADTLADIEWKLGYLTGHFGRCELLEIEVAQVDAFRDELARRARVIRDAAARGKPLVDTVTRRDGTSYKRRKRALSNTSINGMLALLGQILQRAVDYELIERNPVRVGSRRQRLLPVSKPPRTFLEVDELLALLEAAGELDDEARPDRRIGRRAALTALALGGFRISELCDMRCQQIDIARARIKVPDAKTAKGVREVEMTLSLRGELARHRAERLAEGLPVGPKDHFFGTRTGKRRDPDRFRDRVLARAVERASTTRTAGGLAALPSITPHSLRRTWATLAAQAGRDPHWISDQIGHTSASFTLEVYQQTRNRRASAEERQAIWELMRFADEPSECPFTRQITRGAVETFGPKNGTMSDFGDDDGEISPPAAAEN